MKPALMWSESIEKILLNQNNILLSFQHDPNSPLVSIHDHGVEVHLNAITKNREEANILFKQNTQ